MVIIDYKVKYHKQIIAAAVKALKQGKAVAYPTDTSYGLAVDAGNIKAIKKLYQIKGRSFNKPVHIVVPSVAYAKRIARWNKPSSLLAKRFWPGPLTLVLELKVSAGGGSAFGGKSKKLKVLSPGTGTIGLRMPRNKIAMDLAKYLGRPITATSANLSGQPDCYSADEIVAQFSAGGGSASGGQKQKYQPDIIINSGKLPKRKPSTLARVFGDEVKILRQGSVSEKQIIKSLRSTK